MLINGSFEQWNSDGSPVGWTIDGVAQQWNKHYDGASSLLFPRQTGQPYTYAYSEPVAIEPGTTYELSAALYKDAGGSELFMYAEYWDGEKWVEAAKVRRHDAEDGDAAGGKWLVKTISFVAPEGATQARVKFRAFRHTNVAADAVFFDEKKIRITLPASAGKVELTTKEKYCPYNIVVTADGAGGDTSSEDALVTRQFPNGNYSNHRVETIGPGVFYRASRLHSVDVPNAVAIEQYAFAGSGLTEAVFPKVERVEDMAFYDNHSLKKLEFTNLKKINGWSFHLSGLEELIIRGETFCDLETTNAFAGTPIGNGTGIIYVSESRLGDYMSDTNWCAIPSPIIII